MSKREPSAAEQGKAQREFMDRNGDWFWCDPRWYDSRKVGFVLIRDSYEDALLLALTFPDYTPILTGDVFSAEQLPRQVILLTPERDVVPLRQREIVAKLLAHPEVESLVIVTTAVLILSDAQRFAVAQWTKPRQSNHHAHFNVSLYGFTFLGGDDHSFDHHFAHKERDRYHKGELLPGTPYVLQLLQIGAHAARLIHQAETSDDAELVESFLAAMDGPLRYGVYERLQHLKPKENEEQPNGPSQR